MSYFNLSWAKIADLKGWCWENLVFELSQASSDGTERIETLSEFAMDDYVNFFLKFMHSTMTITYLTIKYYKSVYRNKVYENLIIILWR